LVAGWEQLNGREIGASVISVPRPSLVDAVCWFNCACLQRAVASGCDRFEKATSSIGGMALARLSISEPLAFSVMLP